MGQPQCGLEAHKRRCAERLAETTDEKVVELVGWMTSAPVTIPELLRLWRGQTERPYPPPAR